jgi:hypothetical protein
MLLMDGSGIQHMLETIGPQLRQLTIRYPMKQLQWPVLDGVLTWCPNLVALRIAAEYISDVLFEEMPAASAHPLQILDLECSDSASPEVQITPDVIWIAVDRGSLPHLRCVRVSARLAWQATKSLRSSTSDLISLLEDMEKKEPLGIETGVWSII